MEIYIHKYGGTSVADLKHIKQAARLVKADYLAAKGLVVVVSAMAGQTDNLAKQAGSLVTTDDGEYDAVVSSGEQVTAGLMAAALRKLGCEAQSLLGWQVPIHTDRAHGRARITMIDPEPLTALIKKGVIPIVAGFQGISSDGRITTLGRGGSDTTAVALAAVLKAKRCLIYTDVSGVHTADPRLVAAARKLDKITYEEMLELASLGSRVLHARSVELAMKYRVPIEVRSTFGNKTGTMVAEKSMEGGIVSGISHTLDEAKITLVGVADKPGVAATAFGCLSEVGLNVDMIVQNISEDGASTDLTFTVAAADMAAAQKRLAAQGGRLCYKKLVADKNVAKISIVGRGMRSAVGVASAMFATLAEQGVNIQVISTSEIKISVLIAKSGCKKALAALHKTFIK